MGGKAKINPIRVERTRRLISQAIAELAQSGAGPMFVRQFKGLQEIEKTLGIYCQREIGKAMEFGNSTTEGDMNHGTDDCTEKPQNAQ